MAGTLYLVATPIGNLDDMPPRVAATFGAVDFVAAEDTRVTLRLLNHLGLKKPMVSYYEHALHHNRYTYSSASKRARTARCAPTQGCPASATPASRSSPKPTPAASAWCRCRRRRRASRRWPPAGQPTARFVFEGFLPVPRRERRERLAALQSETRTILLYEAPHKLRTTLDDLAAALGAERR